ncbi:Ms4533A family Cys-rich leader peptide [Streptomyces sp. HNM0575]
MPRHHLPERTAYRLVLLGVSEHAVSDIHCR